MENKINQNVEHRGNDSDVAEKLLLEMQLLSNINQKKPVYSFEKKRSNKKVK